jgi:hypothetical protein
MRDYVDARYICSVFDIIEDCTGAPVNGTHQNGTHLALLLNQKERT